MAQQWEIHKNPTMIFIIIIIIFNIIFINIIIILFTFHAIL